MSAPTFYRSDGFVKSSLGPAVPGALIFVCQQPANLPTSLTAAVPTPTPLQGVFSDPNGLVPITQPILTDGFGHYDFYVTPGTYTVAVYLSNVLQQAYEDQTFGLANAADSLTAGTGIAIVGNTISAPRICSFNFEVDGAGSAITTGVKGQWNVPVNCTITGWVLTSDVSGSCVVDVLRSTYAGFPTTASIAGSDKPTLSSAQKNENLSVSAWTTALNAGDQLQINVNSASTVTRVNLTLNVTVP